MNRDQYTRDPVEHKGHFFCKNARSKHDVSSTMSQTRSAFLTSVSHKVATLPCPHAKQLSPFPRYFTFHMSKYCFDLTVLKLYGSSFLRSILVIPMYLCLGLVRRLLPFGVSLNKYFVLLEILTAMVTKSSIF